MNDLYHVDSIKMSAQQPTWSLGRLLIKDATHRQMIVLWCYALYYLDDRSDTTPLVPFFFLTGGIKN